MHILYVDDESDIRDVAAMALDLDGDMAVSVAGSGAEAISEAARLSPDLILLDVMMPDLDGPSTLERLRATPRTASIPVIFITARAQAQEVQRFLAMGAVGVIAKPFDPMTLAAQVRSIFTGLDDRSRDAARSPHEITAFSG